LLAKQLGGAGHDARNLVTLYQNPVNSPFMRGYENLIRNAVEAGETILYDVKPIYSGAQGMPAALTLQASGDNGFSLFLTILNR